MLPSVRRWQAGDGMQYVFLRGGLGFDPKVLRALISIRRKEPAEVEEQETLLDVYRRALGMA